jgi:26S proteasome regulatory subunit N1
MENSSRQIRLASTCGLAIAYAGQQRQEIMELLIPTAANTESTDIMEVCLAALALGVVYVGTCDDEIAI